MLPKHLNVCSNMVVVTVHLVKLCDKKWVKQATKDPVNLTKHPPKNTRRLAILKLL